MTLSAVAWSEFLCGPVSGELVDLARTLLGARYVFGAAEAEDAAGCSTAPGAGRESLLDCLIAANAIRAGAKLATDIPRDFERFIIAGL